MFKGFIQRIVLLFSLFTLLPFGKLSFFIKLVLKICLIEKLLEFPDNIKEISKLKDIKNYI